jgi:hypothetical protein
MSIQELERAKVLRVDRYEFELDDGSVYHPAYSSLIGMTKFMRQYGLSSDTAAAMASSRRAMFFSERVPLRNAYPDSANRRDDELFDGGKHVSCPLELAL